MYYDVLRISGKIEFSEHETTMPQRSIKGDENLILASGFSKIL
jgi:hypothetical protein